MSIAAQTRFVNIQQKRSVVKYHLANSTSAVPHQGKLLRMEPRISIITLGVSDLQRSTRFYRDGLGLPADTSFDSITFFKLRGTWLSLYPREELANIGTASLELRLVGGRLAQRSMSILHERYAANADTGEEMLTHAGEEGGVVVKGKIELTVGGESRVLSVGDAYYFKSSVPHRFRNVGREECEIVSASSPPTF